ncbi:lytic polysaccharide monooxygenase [Micromonospora sp. HM5-17]|jgi:chitin-binding protein|uniref:lytic polysaccharide monooxygenase n=1 Tax=Micromonospora sp. HM5-17 TaxID=2487710 RepID=UPI000F488F9B|nr:lytic polysaccharide monooxygenase [Micromonospora sp. HM5-17]ROT34122.1 cellulose-binding protein [Micromonospora sp. HM5-17]
MRRPVVLTTATAAAVLASVLVAVPAAQAHGYVSSPPSRQALCAQRVVPDCGQIQYEPQSVEGPKGLRNCHANNARFAVLNDDSRNWPATSVGSTVNFTWVLTARHATSTWEYYIGNTRLAVFDDGGRQPPATVSHTVYLGGFTGRQKLLAIWNIADTANAFYACVDLQIGGGGNPNPTPTPTRTPTPPPATTAPPTTPPPAGGTWRAGTTYQVGSQVTYGGLTYRCRQAHTALPGWEPPNVPALWERI